MILKVIYFAMGAGGGLYLVITEQTYALATNKARPAPGTLLTKYLDIFPNISLGINIVLDGIKWPMTSREILRQFGLIFSI